MHNEKLLIIEDDPQIQKFICYILKEQGFDVLSATNGQNGLSILLCNQIDLILLDLGLPDIDGMQIIKKVRQWSDVPIIVVSARDQDKEKAAALDLGADDYLTKPFSATELMARIRVALRHLHRQNTQALTTLFHVGELDLDLQRHQVILCGQPIHLTPMEFKLLTLLFKNMGKVLTTGYILKEIWGIGYGNDTQALRALMASLRRKIEQNPSKPRYIQTEVGVGYRLTDE